MKSLPNSIAKVRDRGDPGRRRDLKVTTRIQWVLSRQSGAVRTRVDESAVRHLQPLHDPCPDVAQQIELTPQFRAKARRSHGGDIRDSRAAPGHVRIVASVDGIPVVRAGRRRPPRVLALLAPCRNRVFPFGLTGRNPPSQMQNAYASYQLTQLMGRFSLPPADAVHV